MENGEVYNSAISSCGLAHEWPAALALMEATDSDSLVWLEVLKMDPQRSNFNDNDRIVEDLGPPFEETSEI